MKKFIIIFIMLLIVVVGFSQDFIDLPDEQLFDISNETPIAVRKIMRSSEILTPDNFKIYITDGISTNYYYGYSSVKFNQIGSDPNHHIVTPFNKAGEAGFNFKDIPFTPQLTTLTIDKSRTLVENKTDYSMEVWSANEIEDGHIGSWFHVAIASGHATACRNKMISRFNGFVDSKNIYAGPISFNSNLIGVARSFGFNMVSVSQSGMNDRYNEIYMPAFKEIDCAYFYAYGGNAHKELFNTTKFGYIYTVSYGNNTGSNQGAFGLGEHCFYDAETCQSYATPKVAAEVAMLRIITQKSWENCKTAYSEACTYFPNWQRDGGYGGTRYDIAMHILTCDPPPKPDPRIFPKYIPKDRALIDK